MSANDEDNKGPIAKPFSNVWARPLPEIKVPLYADTTYEHVTRMVAEFEADLAADEEVGARLTNFGESITIHVEELGFQNPNILVFYGLNARGERCTLIQHMSQLNLLLVALKVPSGQKPRRIGFSVGEAASAENSKA